MKIFKIILIIFIMSITVWGLLAKSAVDNETVEEAIARLITAHNDDETAHLDTGQALQSHKASEIIDHVAGSVVTDKLADYGVTSVKITTNQIVGKDIRTATDVGSGVNGVKMTSDGIEMWQDAEQKVGIPVSGNPFFNGILRVLEMHFLRNFWYTSFASLDSWLQSGTGTITLSVGPLTIQSGAVTNNIKSLYGQDYTGEFIDTSFKDVSFETGVKLVNNSNVEYVFGINMVAGAPDNSYLANGVSFEVLSNKLYAVKYRDDGTRDATEIQAATPTGYHRYRIDFVSGASIKYYVDGVLEHTYTTNLPGIIPSYPFGYSVKTKENLAKYMYIVYLSLETPFD